jgi:hypothetical protein
MAESVVRLLSDREYAHRLTSAARAWVDANFSVEASARRRNRLRRVALAPGGRQKESACASL